VTDASPGSRDRIVARAAASGVGTSVHFIPLHLHPYWREAYGLSAKDFPISQNAFERSVSLPIYSRMSDSDVRHVISTITAAVDP
jgi:dTDP-4-amino-4,6-dideoxygalactose transaminase